MSEYGGKNHQDFYKPQGYNELPHALQNPATSRLRFVMMHVFLTLLSADSSLSSQSLVTEGVCHGIH